MTGRVDSEFWTVDCPYCHAADVLLYELRRGGLVVFHEQDCECITPPDVLREIGRRVAEQAAEGAS